MKLELPEDEFYDDEETFVESLDNVMDIAEGMVMEKFQRYLDASEDDQIQRVPQGSSVQ